MNTLYSNHGDSLFYLYPNTGTHTIELCNFVNNTQQESSSSQIIYISQPDVFTFSNCLFNHNNYTNLLRPSYAATLSSNNILCNNMFSSDISNCQTTLVISHNTVCTFDITTNTASVLQPDFPRLLVGLFLLTQIFSTNIIFWTK
jgi:hypothetical protein